MTFFGVLYLFFKNIGEVSRKKGEIVGVETLVCDLQVGILVRTVDRTDKNNDIVLWTLTH